MTKERFIFLLLWIFFPASYSWSQTGTISVKWGNPIQISSAKGVITVLNFNGAEYSAQNSYLPTLYFEINNVYGVTNLTITNPVYVPLTEQEVSLLSSVQVPANYGINSFYGIERKVPITTVSMVPIVLNSSSGSYEKLVSFQYSYQAVALRKAAVNAVNYAASSVLSSGNWYKLSIPSTGMYKIDYGFLQTMGIDPSSVDPNTIRLFGNGGGMLPQANNISRYDDLQENAIFVQGGNDGKFDNTDYVLFYGTGPDAWSYNSTKSIYTHTKNIYSDSTFYFLTYGGAAGLRVSNIAATSSGSSNTITTYTDYAFYESDKINLLNSGRTWLGETFNQTNLSFSVPAYTFEGLVPSAANKITTYLVANLTVSSGLYTSTTFEVSVNGANTGNVNIGSITSTEQGYQNVGTASINTFSLSSLNSNTVNVGITYNMDGNVGALGYLGYVEFNMQRTIGLYINPTNNTTQTNFRCIKQTVSASSFVVNNVTDNTVSIWDVTTPILPQNQPYTLTSNQATFTANADTNKEYIVFQGNGFNNPSFIGQISNQNLHGITQIPTMAIVTTKAFINEATKFQNFKQQQGITNEVYYLEEIYNEFSSGAQDITAIRDFMRMLYSKSNNLKYLLLFGDCSYDYKNRISNNTNIVPVYESYESLSPTATFSSDDYYALLDSNEGSWPESGSNASLINERLDLGVGRFPVKTSSDADAIINKITNYVTNVSCLGKWRNQIAIVADNLDQLRIPFLSDAEANVAAYIPNNYNIDKLYMDAYPLVSTPDGNLCPELNTAIQEEIEKGALMVDYVGHGGETVWAQEQILTISLMDQWKNYNSLPFFVTATCDFGRYDDPAIISGSETLLLLAQGGGVGSLSSTRPVEEGSNNVINKAFISAAFTPVNKIMPTLGTIMQTTKNNALGVGNRNYALLGDPSLTLAYPIEQINITKINNVAVTASDTIKALEKITLTGEIRSHIDSSLLNFNGTLYLTTMDKPSEVVTDAGDFYTSNNFLYEGSASVVKGAFNITFVVPKDIAYNYGYGKISLYAQKTDTTTDAHGIDATVIIGGSISNPSVDVTPPTVKLYMQDTTFVSGGLTGANTVLLVHLTDANGINVSGEGIGHGITAVLDGNTENTINLNSYYNANKDTYTSGTISFPMTGLSPGVHTIQLTAWDTYDNSAVATIEFIVANTENLALQNVLNYPNPFTSSTAFHFDHNREGDDIEVLVQIYSVSGSLIHTIDEKISSSTSHIITTEWNGRNDFGDKLGKGVYVYKLKAQSLRDGSNTFKYQKLVILN